MAEVGRDRVFQSYARENNPGGVAQSATASPKAGRLAVGIMEASVEHKVYWVDRSLWVRLALVGVRSRTAALAWMWVCIVSAIVFAIDAFGFGFFALFGLLSSARATSSRDGGPRDRCFGPTRSGRQLRAAADRQGQTRFDGFDDKILSLYARGMTVREIQGHLAELYGSEVSPDLISRVTDAVLDEVREWQNRPLDPVYPVVFFRCAAGQDPGRGPGQEQGRLVRV
jgi:hypothetical protein